MCKKLICLIACALLLSTAGSVRAAVLEITPDAPVPGALDIANFVGSLTDADNVGTEDDSNNPPYWNDWCTYVAHDRGGQGQTFVTGDGDVVITGVWVRHVTYSGANPDQTWYRMQPGAELEIRITDPAAAGTDAFVLARETYVVTGEEENALPADTTNDQTGTSLWFHITLDAPVALAANKEYGFDLTSLSGKAGIMFFETDGINDRAEGGNPYEAGTAYTSGVNPDDHGDDLNGANDNNMVVAPGDHVFVVELESAQAPKPELVTAFSDDFETPHDYLTEGLGAYDGMLNGTIEVLDASISRAGSLYMQTANAVWDPGPGPLLYVNVTGDFVATVKVTDFAGETGAIVEHNDSGIVARDPADDGADDWVSVNYFPTWTAFNVRSTDDGVRSEHGQPAGSWEGVDTFALAKQYPYIQLERVGSDFYPRISADGVNFIPLTEETYQGIYDGTQTPLVISRPDLPDTLQVGLMNCTYTAGSGYAVFDDFRIDLPVKPVAPVHSYTFEDGTANDSVGSAHGTLVGDAAVVDGQLVLDGDGDWMDMPGDVIAMNTFEELTIEIMFTSVAGGNTGFHMVTAFGEEGTGDNPGFGYKYICITPARGDNVSRGMIQTVSMDNDPWSEETGVSDVIEHDDGLPHHMVCTVDDTELAFYIDGVLIGTAALDPPGNSIAGLGTDVARIGKGVYGVDPLWAGSVEELNIYDRALSLAEVQARYAAGPFKGLVHSYTFEDGTANDSVGSADGTLVGDAAVVGGALVLDGDGDWMEMPGDVIAMNTYPEVTVETWFTSVEGGNTGFHMLTAFGEEATGALDWAGYKYLFITPARGDDVSRAAIQTNSMDDSPWDDETGVSAAVEHDDGLEHHFVATVDAANITFYIDGELIGSEPLAPGNEIAGIGQAVAYLGKGVYPADPLWTGSVEELNIYNRALSLDEVQANYAAGPQKEGPVPIDPGTDGLMLHLPLDTASRGTTKDSSGNGIDGTVVGDPTFVEGVDILAISLDGIDDYVDCGNPGILDFGTGDFTISAWINITAIERGTVYAKGGDNSGGVRYTLAMAEENDNKMTLTTDDDSTKVQAKGETVVNDGAWHHVVGMRSGTDLLVYVDGVLDGTNTVPEGYDLSGTSQANALIGAITDASDATGATLEKFFAGAIDDLRIYNRALSALEVLFLAGM